MTEAESVRLKLAVTRLESGYVLDISTSQAGKQLTRWTGAFVNWSAVVAAMEENLRLGESDRLVKVPVRTGV